MEAPDPHTVVFKLKLPSGSLLADLASPWNVIFPKKYLDKDPNYFKKNVMGSGPFKFKGYTRGSTFEGERNPDYFVKDRPYLNGYKFFISTETSVRAAAIRSGRAYVEFRDLPLAEVEASRSSWATRSWSRRPRMIGHFGIAINNNAKPFSDIRVRKALTLGIDRYTAGKVLYPLTGLRDAGAFMRPGTEWAMSPAELEKFPGFWRDVEKSRAEAKKLLAEAGYPNGFKVVLKNRNVKLPYQDFAVYTIQEWRKIGIEAEHRPLETATWFADGRDQGNFELMVCPAGAYIDDPDQLLYRYTTGSPRTGAASRTPRIDDLYSRQARTLDPAERRKLVIELQKVVLRERELHARALVVAQHRALGQGEELRRRPATSPTRSSRTSGCRRTEPGGDRAMRTYLAQATAADRPDAARGRDPGVPHHAGDPRATWPC